MSGGREGTDVPLIVSELRRAGWSRDGIRDHLVEKVGLTYFDANDAVDLDDFLEDDGDGSGESDPPLEPATPESLSIGGWLLLPAIHLPIRAVVIIVGLVEDLKVGREWDQLIPAGRQVLAVEIGGLLLLLGLTCFCTFLFYSRSRRAPGWMMAWYAAALVFAILNTMHVEAHFPEADDGPSIARAVIPAIIWISYFSTSKRVRKTFVY